MKAAPKAAGTKTSTGTKTATATKTATSTKAYTQGNITVTGGAGAGHTTVHISPLGASAEAGAAPKFLAHRKGGRKPGALIRAAAKKHAASK